MELTPELKKRLAGAKALDQGGVKAGERALQDLLDEKEAETEKWPQKAAHEPRED